MAYKDKKAGYQKQNAWVSKMYDKINLTVPKGQRAIIQQYAKANNMSTNQFIRQLIYNELNNNEKEI